MGAGKQNEVFGGGSDRKNPSASGSGYVPSLFEGLSDSDTGESRSSLSVSDGSVDHSGCKESQALFGASEKNTLNLSECEESKLINDLLQKLKTPLTLDEFYSAGFSTPEIISVLLLSYIFNFKLYDSDSLKSFLGMKNDYLYRVDYGCLVALYENKDKFSFINSDLFIVLRFIICDESFGEFIGLLPNCLGNKVGSDKGGSEKMTAGEFIILYLFFKNEGPGGFISYETAKSQYFEDFEGVNIADKDFKKKYSSFVRSGKYKFFSLKCIKFTFEHFVQKTEKSKSSFDNYINFWKKEDICKVDRMYGKSRVMSLLKEKFGITGRELFSVVDYEIDLSKLEQFINLFVNEEFLSSKGIEPSYLNLSLGDIVQYLNYDREEQLFRISMRFSKLSDKQVAAGKKLQTNQIDSISEVYGGRSNVSYKYPEPILTEGELERVNHIQKSTERCLTLINILNNRVNFNKKRVEEIKSQSPGERSRVVEFRRKTREEGREKCDDYFRSGINFDNYELMFSEYLDIIFDGDDCDMYLSQLPTEIINDKNFFDKL